MFQHTGRHIKRRPTCCPETEGVTPPCLDYPPSIAGFQPQRKFDEIVYMQNWQYSQ